jgi:hypothetical protein
MPEIRWNQLKSERLKKTRGASFEDILTGNLIGVKKHVKKSHQNIMLFEYNRYIWLVPYVVENNGNIFLKTLYPSRKYTKLFMKGKL